MDLVQAPGVRNEFRVQTAGRYEVIRGDRASSAPTRLQTFLGSTGLLRRRFRGADSRHDSAAPTRSCGETRARPLVSIRAAEPSGISTWLKLRFLGLGERCLSFISGRTLLSWHDPRLVLFCDAVDNWRGISGGLRASGAKTNGERRGTTRRGEMNARL
jgi:hypothetical protein